MSKSRVSTVPEISEYIGVLAQRAHNCHAVTVYNETERTTQLAGISIAGPLAAIADARDMTIQRLSLAELELTMRKYGSNGPSGGELHRYAPSVVMDRADFDELLELIGYLAEQLPHKTTPREARGG